MLWQFKINGIDVTSYIIDAEIEEAYGNAIATATINCIKAITTAVTIVEGQSVEIWRGSITATDVKVFSGYIQKYCPNVGKLEINCNDKLWDLVRKEITHVYDSTIDASAGKISEIFKDIVTTYGGLNADATSIQDSGVTQLITVFRCNHTDLFERCQALAVALEWQFYYRADTDKVYFEPKGYPVNGNTLTIGTNVQKIPKWNYDITEMVNDLTIVGASSNIQTTETGRIGTTAGYTTTSVLLSFTPVSVKFYNDNTNPPTTLKIGGVENSTATFDYSVDYSNKLILPKSGSTFVNASYAKIDYSFARPVPIHMINSTSVSTYGTFKKTQTYTDITSVEDARNRATLYLSRYAVPFIYTTLQIQNGYSMGIRVGQLIRIIDNINSPNVDKTLVINAHRIRYPADFEELDVGDKMWRLAEWQTDIQNSLKRLAENEIQNQDIIVELIDINNDSINPLPAENIYIKVQTRTLNGNQFIWDSSNWDEKYWVDEASADGVQPWNLLTNAYIAQNDNLYFENFSSTDFKDSSTTGTWTTGGLVLTSTQTGISKSIDSNNGTITTATLTAIATGTHSYYLSADGGSHWEIVTSGTPYTFANTGTDLRWKAVCTSNGTITSIVIENYH